MLVESLRSMLRRRRSPGQRRKLHKHGWFHGLPFKTRFPKSRLYISALAPIAIGALGGFLTAIMGIGGGFILVPAMIYLLGMPASLVAGTSLFQIIFTTALVCFLQAFQNQTVDVLLALLLLAGGVVSLLLLPVANAMSRAHERRADRYALDMTRNAAAFISAMRRLAAQNLAEERPSRWVEILFHSHPSTAARIDAARAWEART
jgi:hypothetical protein